MNIEIKHDALLQEDLHRAKLDSGLEIFVLPKRGYQKKYASFATHYGSIDNCFKPPQGDEVCVPDGIAHFLEHTLFEKENGNASDWFSQLGVSANAYTSYLLTTYLFSGTDQFDASLDLLVNFVLEPYFSKENVDKERGIIEQELLMYDDMPDRRLILALMEAMYQKHPVRIDIGGTIESISRVTPDLLAACYRTFYHPENMALFVIGDVEPRQVIDQVAENIGQRGFSPRGDIDRIFPDEPEVVNERMVEIEMTASRPRLALGYKESADGLTGKQGLRQRILSGLVLRSTLGRSSELYTELYEQGLIDDSFSSYFESSPHYSHTLIGGETKDPDRLLSRLQEGFAKQLQAGIAEDEFERLKRAYLGRFLDGFNSLDHIASSFLSHHFRGTSLFDTIDVVGSLTVDEANERLQSQLATENYSVCILRPKE